MYGLRLGRTGVSTEPCNTQHRRENARAKLRSTNAKSRPIRNFHQVAGGCGCVLSGDYRLMTRVLDADTLAALGEREARHSFTICFPSVCFGNPSSLAATAHSTAL